MYLPTDMERERESVCVHECVWGGGGGCGGVGVCMRERVREREGEKILKDCWIYQMTANGYLYKPRHLEHFLPQLQIFTT